MRELLAKMRSIVSTNNQKKLKNIGTKNSAQKRNVIINAF